MECRLWNIWKSALCLRSVDPVLTGKPVLHAESRSGAAMNVIICWSALSRFANRQKINQPVPTHQKADIRLFCKPPGIFMPGG